MKIDGKKIIQETVEVFTKSGFMSLLESMPSVSESDYHSLHTKSLVKTSISIDTNKLIEQLEPYVFKQWGKNHLEVPRYGLALVNQSGELIEDDPVNGSLMAWNKEHPDSPLIETDCVKPTEVLAIPALKPLHILNDYWTRSNVFKWDNNAYFTPHIDTCIPSAWLRLWMGTEGVVVRFYNEQTEELEVVEYEPGVLYIIDTSKIHDAYSVKDNVYQLFLSVHPNCYSILKSIVTV